MIFDYISFVLNDIKTRKFSSFLTFFAIGLGILSIYLIVLISTGFEQSIQNEFEKMGTNRIIIMPKNSNFASLSKGLTDKDVNLIENRPYVKEVFPYYVKTLQLKHGNEYITKMVLGSPMTKEHFESFGLDIVEGRYPRESDKYVAIVGPEIKDNFFSKRISVGSSIEIKERKFKVIGITKSLGNPEDDSNIYVDFNALRTLDDDSTNKNTIHMMYVTIQENYDVKLAADNIKVFLENRLGKDKVEVQTLEEMLESFNTILNIIKLTLGGIAFVSLIVGALGIINTMFVIITEKTKDIGVMKAIGAKNKDIFSIYILQSGMFGLLGGIFGMIMGNFLAFMFELWAQSAGFTFLEINTSITLMAYLLIFSFSIGAISGFIPSYRASKLKIVDTFRK